jgi:CRISPR-associated endonuclease/helicase Cas3
MPTIYDLWAKTNDRDRAGGEPWRRHPLPLHLLDVALVAEAWLDADEGLFRRFCALWPEADAEAVRRALVLAAAVHDLGKVYPDFQRKSEEGWALGYGPTWEGSAPGGTGFDHGEATARAFRTLFGDRLQGPPDGFDPAWQALAPLVRVAAGHHGTLYATIGRDRHLRAEPWLPLVAALLDEVAHHVGPLPALPSELPPPFLLLAAGFVSVADWFGSNADSFPLAPDVTSRADAEAYLARHREDGTARTALAEAGLLARFAPPDAFGDLFQSDDGTRWTPRPGFQNAACAIDFGATPGAEIAIVEAPMGLGKTEIALWLASRAILHGSADGIYDALPTQATANAAFGRVRRVAERLGSDTDLALTLAHGAKRFVAEHRALHDDTLRRAYTSPSVSASDGAAPAEVVAPSWLQPSKRALLAPVGVGTVDQALLGAMGVRHGFVRLFALARKVIVIDEVHAYDAYTGAILRHLLRWLGALGTKVILLSATLPASLRASLLDAYGATDAGEAPDAYPRLVHARPDAEAAVVTDPRPHADRQQNEKTIRVEPVEPAANRDTDARTAAGVAWVRRKLAAGGCVAWIRNTVREAQDAARVLRDAGEPVELLHARFARADRNRIEDDLLRRLGPPGADRPARLAVVATQVIEQSVDLDFDAMLSDLAPVDLLLQRAGRLWRHDDRTPDQRHDHDAPVLGVLMPTPADRAALAFGPSAYVYDADTLARSAVLVQENPTWTLPAACRALVDALYDGDWPASRLGADPARLDAAREALAKQTRRMETAARRAFLSTPDTTPQVREARADRSDAGAHVTLTTRYGAHSAAAVLLRDTPAGPVPFGADAPLAPPGGPSAGSGQAAWDERFAAEEAVELASVSFPWYGERPECAEVSDALDGLRTWWREMRPYDDRLFVLLRDGSFQHGSLGGRYSPVSGLHLARPGEAPPEAPPFEDI